MKKLMKKEIEVISGVVCKKVEVERKRVMEEKLKKDKDWGKLLKEGEELDKLLKVVKGKGDEINGKIKKLNEKYKLSGGSNNGWIGWSGINVYGNSDIKINYSSGYVMRNEVIDKLILKNIGGDVDVDKLIGELVKEML